MDNQFKSMIVNSIEFLAWFSLIGGVVLGIANGNTVNLDTFEESFSFFVFFTYFSYGLISCILFIALAKAMVLLEDIREYAKERTEYLKEIKKSMDVEDK